jgi:outer membrane protein assembly factor BamB
MLIKVVAKMMFTGFLLMQQAYSQRTMFLGSADHSAVYTTQNNDILTAEKWKLTIGAPVRATAALSGGQVYIGSSNGIFYSISQETGTITWQYDAGDAIHSTAAIDDGIVYFTDNKQALHALNAKSGKKKWTMVFDKSLAYPWAFDYYYSSPVIDKKELVIGIKDGHVYNIDVAKKVIRWKFKTQGIVRSTPAISGDLVFAADTEGMLYALDRNTGKEQWRFAITGNSLKNEDFGFDRRAIISSPVVIDNKVIFGGRDGFLYAVDKNTGKELWRNDHQVSWVISSVAVKDSIVITGTSDGRFVQAVHLDTGKELWKFKTISIVWSSPVIINDQVYIGSQEGEMYCLHLRTGKKINSFQAGGRIFPSPVVNNNLLVFGTDNGFIYALQAEQTKTITEDNYRKFVYWEPGVQLYFRPGTDIRIREYLSQRGFTVIDAPGLSDLLSKTDSSVNSVIVFASCYFPPEIVNNHAASLLRKYLDNGGKIILLGMNPLLFNADPLTKAITGRNFLKADSVLNIGYRYPDLRSFLGYQPAFPTVIGKVWGLRKPWVAPLSLPVENVNIVLGKDENGLASAWVKKYHPAEGSGLVQLWIDGDGTDDLSEVIRVAIFKEE